MLDASVEDQVARLLDGFGKALEAGDIEGVTAFFQEDCYWRDLVSFTWNIKTMEGKDEIGDMLRQQLDAVKPRTGRSRTARRPRKRTASRRRGPVRDRRRAGLRPDPAEGREDLDTADHDGGAQRATRSRWVTTGRSGAEHGAGRNRESWKEEREARGARARLLAPALGGDRGRRPGRHRARRPAAPARRADDHRREERPRRATAGAAATSRSACTIRSGTTICPICRSRRTGRCSRPRTSSATGWRCTRGSWS